MRVLVAAAWLAAIAALLALGTWQVHRRAWKLDLIARVDARLAAPAVPAPARAGPDDAYRRVEVAGTYAAGKDSFVQAVTERGAGWWVLTPLVTRDGRIVLVNRGYVADRAALSPPRQPLVVTGLLRLSEPGGGFLRVNDPAADRWYSRDVDAIARRRKLRDAAPYFIDADAAAGAHPGDPVGGLTVVRFANNHLAYAITWYMLAMMAIGGFCYWVMLDRRRADR